MKFSKRYVLFALLVVGALLWKLNSWEDRYARVDTFRGAQLKEEVFYPLMAKNINETGALSVYVNDEAVSGRSCRILLDNSLAPVISLSTVRDLFDSSYCRVDDTSAILLISDDIYEFLLGNLSATLNGDEFPLTVSPQLIEDEYYIGLEDLCQIYDFSYSYDQSIYRFDIYYSNLPGLPVSYDLREFERVSTIRDQGSASSCWACASIEAIESGLLPAKSDLLSVDHMINKNSFGLKESQGGDYTMAVAYLLGWQGPVAEKDYSSILDVATGAVSPKKEAYHVQEVHFFDSSDLESIKWAVYKYGGVSTSIYANVGNSNLEKSGFYNRKTNSYCYTGNNSPNHDVVIIGWDDNYSKENFSAAVERNGAFICQNSWGSSFGDKGVFYISYCDTNVGNQGVAYVSVEPNTNFDNIYQSDLCGWVGQMGYSKEKAFGANVFTAKGDELISAAGFYTLGKNSSYQLFFVPKYKNIASLTDRILVASGGIDDAGYYTVDFDVPQAVKAGEQFAIVLSLYTPQVARPLAIEYVSDNMSANVDITDGKGYVSSNGLDWASIEDEADANLCIKAYSKNNKGIEEQ